MDKKQEENAEKYELPLPVSGAIFVTTSVLVGVAWNNFVRKKPNTVETVLNDAIGATIGFGILHWLGVFPGRKRVDRPSHEGTVNPSPDHRKEISGTA